MPLSNWIKKCKLFRSNYTGYLVVNTISVKVRVSQTIEFDTKQLRCQEPLRKAGAEADDTIYVTEKILGKFYPSREDKSEANTKNMIEDLLKKLSGRRYYEEIENNRIQKENEIFNRHVTISERIDKILKIKKSVTRPVFDVKQILKKP